jgi:hypothetical protein
MNKLKRRIDKACGKRTALHDSIFLDAMLPEFKAANAELLKAIKMNDKSGAIPYTELLEINKAMKENDADKAGQALKKVQEKLTKAEKALDEEIKTATAKLAESKKASATAAQTLKAQKALAPVFDKAKSACDAAKQSPKNASKLTVLTDKLKEYGDLSKRVSQIVTMSASGKDIAKQLDMLKKSIDAAEKKYKKDVATVEKNVQKSKDELEKATLNQKVAQTKRDSFQKERLYIANVVKQMPQGDVRQKGREQKEDYKALAAKIYDKFVSVKKQAEKEALKIADLYEKKKFDWDGYEKRMKKLIWSAYESIPKREFEKASDIVRSAYKFNSYLDRDKLLNEVVKAKTEINGKGGDYKKYLSPIIDYVKQADVAHNMSNEYPFGLNENDAWNLSHYKENGNLEKMTLYFMRNVSDFKNKVDLLTSEYEKIKEKSKAEGVKIPRNLYVYDKFV